MRILAIHSDYIEVEPMKKAVKDAEEIKSKEKKRFDEVLVVFTSVEQGDEDAVSSSARLAEEVIKVAEQVKIKNVLLYPLVHLTSKPSAPKIAKEVIFKAEELLNGKGYTTSHSPFGWYKGYTMKCKGHPLSELSREFHGPGSVDVKPSQVEPVSTSLRAENTLKSQFYILDLEGKLHETGEFDYGKYPDLKKFMTYETKKTRAYDKEPPHIQLMKDHQLIDYEPGSDSGNFRFYPKGRLMKSLLEKAITEWCVNYGAMEVETPIMYDYEHPALKKYLNRFPARQYVVLSEDKTLFLRFAACFGSFIMLHDATIPYKIMPLKIFELTKYSFRREQSGELAGLKRLRAFTMPDMHTLTVDTESAKAEFENQYGISLEWMRMMDLDYEVGFRVQEDFFNENKPWYVNMVKKFGKPILVEIFKERYAYFITKFEFNFVDVMGKASALSTVQIDVENSDTFDISFIDKNGEKKRPLILHASLSGSLERVIYALLEKEALKMKKGEKGMFPVWLSPNQLRIIPVSEKQKEHALKLAEKLAEHRFRVDCDDRDETLGKKIRDAEKEWIPYIAVIGDKEIESGSLTVTIRSSGGKKQMTESELIEIIEKENEGKPFEKLSLNMRMSKLPVLR